jgi:hypothetical protein
MEQSKQIATCLVASVLAFSAISCAANTSDDSAAAGAGNASSAGANSGGSAAGGAPSNGASGSVGIAGTSAGGTTSAGGGSGTAGSSSTGDCPAIDAADLISNFDTGVAQVLMTGGRGGDWFVFNDGTGMQTPVKVPNTPLTADMGGACGSTYAFHSTATGFTVFGAGFGADFAPKAAMATGSTVYDASAYSGIALRAKAANPVDLRVSVSDAGTAPEGMICTDTTDKTDKTRCGDYFGSDVMVGTDWKDFVVPFATMTQRGIGLPIATGIDKSKIYTLRAQVKGSAAAPCVFDLWIDDVRFVK